MRRKLSTVLFGILYACLIAGTAYNIRTVIPYPSDYMTRLVWLEDFPANGRHGLDCASFISNSHGEAYIGPGAFYDGADGKLEIVAEFDNRADIDPNILQPGDVAAFHGVHVAAYLGHDLWIDADTRRGNVARFYMEEKPASDVWFQGPVRILRWAGRERGRRSHIPALPLQLPGNVARSLG